MSATKSTTSSNGDFFKSSYSNDGPSCVEVKFDGDRVLIRDSKQNSEYLDVPNMQPTIACPDANWSAFLDLALNMDSGVVSDDLTVSVHEDGGATVTGADVALIYNRDEWVAFAKGVAAGEFARP